MVNETALAGVSRRHRHVATLGHEHGGPICTRNQPRNAETRARPDDRRRRRSYGPTATNAHQILFSERRYGVRLGGKIVDEGERLEAQHRSEIGGNKAPTPIGERGVAVLDRPRYRKDGPLRGFTVGAGENVPDRIDRRHKIGNGSIGDRAECVAVVECETGIRAADVAEQSQHGSPGITYAAD